MIRCIKIGRVSHIHLKDRSAAIHPSSDLRPDAQAICEAFAPVLPAEMPQGTLSPFGLTLSAFRPDAGLLRLRLDPVLKDEHRIPRIVT